MDITRGRLALVVTILVLIIGIPSMSAVAGENGMQVDVDVALGAAYRAGETQYQIGGTVVWDNFGLEQIHFPISELKWPVDAFWATVRGDVRFDRWRFSASLQKNLTDDPGDMEDRDWGVYGYPYSHRDTLDIYSETDLEMDSWIWDISTDYTFYKIPQWSFFAGLGYTYQTFDFEGRNTRQTQRWPITNDSFFKRNHSFLPSPPTRYSYESII
jgi:hypothetical protein